MGMIFRHFFMLGWICFGGPAAHVGYFKRHFVDKLVWLDEAKFANQLALCQFLPGPTSSQLGFAIGYHRAGIRGAMAAFIGFTFPSFLLMYLLAVFGSIWSEAIWFNLIVDSLKLLAVVVVADAIISMSKSFCSTITLKLIAFLSAATLIIFPSAVWQVLLLLIFGGYGYLSSHIPADKTLKLSVNWRWVAVFLLVFITLISVATQSINLNIVKQLYLSGSLVFGGGHVVLPLLQTSFSDMVSLPEFMTGYGFAQMVPGPMFSFASYLGAMAWQGSALLGAIVATVTIFTPGFLLFLATVNTWNEITSHPRIRLAVQYLTACVVGILLAAWVTPIITQTINSGLEVILSILGFILLRLLKWHLLLVAFFITGAKIIEFIV
ncbi:MAG: chromate efflux transporter [Parashewanella sp.]